MRVKAVFRCIYEDDDVIPLWNQFQDGYLEVYSKPSRGMSMTVLEKLLPLSRMIDRVLHRMVKDFIEEVGVLHKRGVYP